MPGRYGGAIAAALPAVMDTLALPGEPGLAAAELEGAETLMAHEGLETDADDVRDNLRRAKRVVSGVSDLLIVDERVAETM